MNCRIAAVATACALVALLSTLGPAAAGDRDKGGASALEQDPQGWTDILPPADLKGWTRLPIPHTGKLGPEQWHVDAANRLLICNGDGGHDWLRYDRELADGIFHVEWRFAKVEGKSGYNSGVFIRNAADGSIWHQAQVGSESGGYYFGDTPIEGKIQRFNLSKQLHDQRVREAGEWNTYELTARGKKLTAWVNGAVTSEFSDCQVPKGYIGLEGEGWRIEFRNIKLKELH